MIISVKYNFLEKYDIIVFELDDAEKITYVNNKNDTTEF